MSFFPDAFLPIADVLAFEPSCRRSFYGADISGNFNILPCYENDCDLEFAFDSLVAEGILELYEYSESKVRLSEAGAKAWESVRLPDWSCYYQSHVSYINADFVELTIEGFDACFVWKKFIDFALDGHVDLVSTSRVSISKVQSRLVYWRSEAYHRLSILHSPLDTTDEAVVSKPKITSKGGWRYISELLTN